ncbi:MAG: hypothetical protein UHB38_09945, partial [Anaerovibrio sp.]|uniref:hypothetical protein n=1 Tax=Anaerovibrio sp. TaxID=1872532 RepID=UPI002E77510B
ECAVVAAFYPGVTWQDVAKSVRTLAKVTKLLATPTGKFRETVNKTLPKNFAAMLMFDEPDPVCSLHDTDLLDCYNRAFAAFPGLEKQIKLHLTWDDAALQLLADQGFDADFGARPLRRLLSHTVETELSKSIIRGDVSEGDTVAMSVENGRLHFAKQ